MDYAKEAWNNQCRQGLEECKSFNRHDAHDVTHSNATRFQMEPKANRIRTHFKSTCIPYAHEHEIFDKEFNMMQLENVVNIFSMKHGIQKGKFVQRENIKTYLLLVSNVPSWLPLLLLVTPLRMKWKRMKSKPI